MADFITQDSALPFGKHLAANEKKTRDKAVRSLRTYLSSGPELSHVDLLKLWKGLFYCFWMSDKPLVQQALANDLGSLVLAMPPSNAIPFLAAFWEVHCEQWYGLDRLRLDKYYLLFRRVIFFSFKFLAEQNWDMELVESYIDMLLEIPLHPTDRTKPDSIRYHIIDIYFGELVKVLDELRETLKDGDVLEIPMEELETPIRVTATDNINKVTRTKAKEAIRQYEESDAMEQDELQDSDEQATDGEEDEEDEEEESCEESQ
ncbi:hypothetical protein BDF14DRAFT_1883460 [Spinellus fusiger]|nr:hypothetical protein BDF14DRAFT_1883460 [Spinellus fusiger]